MSHLLASGPYGMVVEHFQDCFHPEDLVNGFPNCSNFVFILHKVTFYPKLHVLLERPTS